MAAKCEMTMTRRRGVLLILLRAVIHALLVSGVVGAQSNVAVKLELIHRHSPRLADVAAENGGKKMSAKSQLGRLRDLIRSDLVRQRWISRRRPAGESAITRRKDLETTAGDGGRESDCVGRASAKMAIQSGADYGTGQYFVTFRTGTPPQKSLLIADTGSDLTWMKCSYRCRRRSRGGRCRRGRRVFRADLSSSFTTFPCSSRMCKIELMNLFSLATCPSSSTPCAYDYRYSDGSMARGIFANETVTVDLTNGAKMKLQDVLVGCSEFSRGPTLQAANGVMGLGYSKYSFAIRAAEKFGGKFSYCLVDHLSPKNLSNYLVFGSHEEEAGGTTNTRSMQQTELVLGVINSFYAVNIRGISVGEKMLEIPFAVWDVNGAGGTILDSGSSLTYLTSPAYNPVMAALRGFLMKFRKVDLDIGPLSYCINSTDFCDDSVPRLAFHFADGARLEPPVKSYIIDAAKGIKCVGIVMATWPGTSVIGNIMQQNHLWEFDLRRSKLGFAPSSCT